jgi:hypothetical protein
MNCPGSQSPGQFLFASDFADTSRPFDAEVRRGIAVDRRELQQQIRFLEKHLQSTQQQTVHRGIQGKAARILRKK